MGLPSFPGEPPAPFRPGSQEPWQVDAWLRSAPAPARRLSAWLRWGRNLALFVLTAISIFLVGSLHYGAAGGVRLAIGLLSILVAHEMGHYLTARYYGVDATLPFFIPFPVPWVSLVGTLGAFIRIRSPIPHRRALFDIGVAGPIAGFVVCLPVLWLGIREATVQSLAADAEGLFMGEPLLFRWLTQAIHGTAAADHTLLMGPVTLAAWFGLLVTALNLMPIGQLDGGHVTYALLRDRAHAISRIASWVCIALIYFGPSWILWALLVRVLGRRHPPTRDDYQPIGRARILVGLLSLVVFALCFVPDPIVFSWQDFFEATGLRRDQP